ncbi:GNAT family N-acetyltransferase [Entamoeba marina]
MSSLFCKHFNCLSTDELLQIISIRIEVFVVEQKIVCEGEFDDNDSNCHHVMYKIDNELVGYCRIEERNKYYKIGRVVVLKQFRKKGIAQQLLKYAILQCKDQSKQCKVSSQLYCKNLYQKVGFIPIGEVFIEAEIEHIAIVCADGTVSTESSSSEEVIESSSSEEVIESSSSEVATESSSSEILIESSSSEVVTESSSSEEGESSSDPIISSGEKEESSSHGQSSEGESENIISESNSSNELDDGAKRSGIAGMIFGVLVYCLLM